MATMYVYNIPTNETVNLRATPNGTILVRVPYGAAVEASPSATSGWHNASYNNYSGYIMSQYLTYTNPSGGGGGGTYLGTGTVIGGGPLYCRKQPIAGYAYWGQFQEGTTVQIYSCSTSGWHETRWPANGTNIGYVMSQYISLNGGGTSSYRAIVCQGNTDDAGDCNVFYNKLNNVYGTVLNKGFTPGSNTPNSTRAGSSDFRNAYDYDVLYWSSHGDSTPYLNLGNGQFNSYTEANARWNSINQRLKVPVFAACRQFDGALNRSRWANIMRQSNIRAFCGYHEGAPGHPYDTQLANSFFNYINAGSTGNSVMYSWHHANQDNGNNSTYMVLVYYNDNQCYYRLPGFSSQTYRDPNRNTDSIYAYASFMTGAVSSVEPPLQNSSILLPYELGVNATVIPAAAVAVPRSVHCSWEKSETGSTFVGYGEYPNTAIDVNAAQAQNLAYAVQAFGSALLEQAQIRNIDTVMFEVFGDGTEGEHIVIGRTTQFLNHYNGIPLVQNCIVITSDANGLHSISNMWRNVAPITDTTMIQFSTTLTGTERQTLSTALQSDDVDERIKTIEFVYSEKNGRYILQRDVELQNGRHILIDSKTSFISS